MAKKAEPKAPTSRRRYPWAEWSNGEWWLLERGEDYVVSDMAIRCAAYAYGAKHNLRTQTSSCETGMYVRFTKPSPAKKLSPLKHYTKG